MEPWQTLNSLSEDDARAALFACCGSTRWVERMLARRPFARHRALLFAARVEWFGLSADDWREAFAHHPRIGDREALNVGSATAVANARSLAAQEQAAVNAAPADVLAALAEGHRAYEKKFGFIFVVCATGKSADEMLALLRARLDHDERTEVRIAAEEQARITEIRLDRIAVPKPSQTTGPAAPPE